MAFKDFPSQVRGVELLQRSLARGRLGHAYLFTGDHIEELEAIARTLAKTLNCRPESGEDNLFASAAKPRVATDSCDACLACRKIDQFAHADVHWVRPESKSRVITVEQMRELMQQIHLKPIDAEYKVAVIVAADRLNVQAANAFLKTLEEPPARSVLILLTTEPQRVLETILSRCLRLIFGGDSLRPLAAPELEWLSGFSQLAATEQRSLIGRYRLLDELLRKLNGMKEALEERLAARSPLRRHEDADRELREKWEEELKAAIEAEYRRERADVLLIVQRWLRDVWLQARGGVQGPESTSRGQAMDGFLNFPNIPGVSTIAQRIQPAQALENLQILESTQRLLHTNVQEALALEVGMLKLHL